MTQLDLNFARARRHDPPTSKAAAARACRFDGDHFRAILAALSEGAGTCYEIAERTWGRGELPRLDHVQCARRLGELYIAGKVKKRGEMKTGNGEVLIPAQTRPGPSGVPCTVWCLP
jgi:hypothetical protein